jgi:G3E family GTPase
MVALELFPSREAGPFGRRVKHARGGRIPVTVLTGFLGAGKTTLLRHFLATPEGRGTAVIVNEYGAVGIDDALIRGSSDQTTLLGNGCVCCVTRTDLQHALRKLVIDRERGEVPPFVRIVIETSGLADPAPILQTFATDQALGGEFFVEVVVTVVDTATGLDTSGWSSESRKQAILADRLVLSKTDLADPEVATALRTRLRELAHAEIVVAGCWPAPSWPTPAGRWAWWSAARR